MDFLVVILRLTTSPQTYNLTAHDNWLLIKALQSAFALSVHMYFLIVVTSVIKST